MAKVKVSLFPVEGNGAEEPVEVEIQSSTDDEVVFNALEELCEKYEQEHGGKWNAIVVG